MEQELKYLEVINNSIGNLIKERDELCKKLYLKTLKKYKDFSFILYCSFDYDDEGGPSIYMGDIEDINEYEYQEKEFSYDVQDISTCKHPEFLQFKKDIAHIFSQWDLDIIYNLYSDGSNVYIKFEENV